MPPSGSLKLKKKKHWGRRGGEGGREDFPDISNSEMKLMKKVFS